MYESFLPSMKTPYAVQTESITVNTVTTSLILNEG